MGPEHYGNILIQCIFEEHRGDGPITVTQLQEQRPDVAEKYVNPMIDNAVLFEKMGMTPDEAAEQAFAPAAVKDESGAVQRAEVSPELTSANVAETPKKK